MTIVRLAGFVGTVIIVSGILCALAATYGLRAIERSYSCVEIGRTDRDNGDCVSGLRRKDIKWNTVDGGYRKAVDTPIDGSEKVVRYSILVMFFL